MNDPEIDVQALIDNLEKIRGIIVRAGPGLRSNHHNLVRVSVIDELITQALSYADSMK